MPRPSQLHFCAERQLNGGAKEKKPGEAATREISEQGQREQQGRGACKGSLASLGII